MLWPAGFARIPEEDWTRAPVASLAQKYDAVGRHGWYANLEPTADDLAGQLRPGDILVDYSGGTGLLIDRLLERVAARDVGVVNVDSSPKFLALSLEKLRDDPRVAFRLIHYLADAKRLQYLDEALGALLTARKADALVSANAIHLYYDLDQTLASWARVLRSGARVHVQSGNIRNPEAPKDAWIIDETVEAVHQAAMGIVRKDARFARYRSALDDATRMAAHDALRRKFFLPPRPLALYVDALERADIRVEATRTHVVRASAAEWHSFLSVYSEGVLGWVGGSPRIEGHEPDAGALHDRFTLMRLALDEVLAGRETFDAVWTYVLARRR
ncbi:MAG TPA: methyltransferase domain-containing protein [Candidatus Thermoplasmatota archaeon]|nr:methyltransferase domain-containing protein [Candidatus Thermoplasmatota archaeon]